MDHDSVNQLSCVVCGIETKRHTGWFLVMDNCWLDRVKIFSWHPVLARTGKMSGVCGKTHLKAVLTHWLSYASLELVGTRLTPMPAGVATIGASCSDSSFALGRALGELAVERDPFSPGWTGSPEARECILDALIGETEVGAQPIELSCLDRPSGYPGSYAPH